MENLKMNIGEQGVEQDRTVDVMGFNNVDKDISKTIKTTVPNDQPAPLMDSVMYTSDTQKPDIGPSAMDITMRTR